MKSVVLLSLTFLLLLSRFAFSADSKELVPAPSAQENSYLSMELAQVLTQTQSSEIPGNVSILSTLRPGDGYLLKAGNFDELNTLARSLYDSVMNCHPNIRMFLFPGGGFKLEFSYQETYFRHYQRLYLKKVKNREIVREELHESLREEFRSQSRLRMGSFISAINGFTLFILMDSNFSNRAMLFLTMNKQTVPQFKSFVMPKMEKVLRNFDYRLPSEIKTLKSGEEDNGN